MLELIGEYCNISNYKLLIYIIILLIFTSADYILFVNWIDTMKNYAFLRSQWDSVEPILLKFLAEAE